MVLGLLAFIWLMRAWRQSLKIWVCIHLLARVVFMLMPQEVDVPSIGKDGILGQWITALQWQQKARSLIQEGYEKVCLIEFFPRMLCQAHRLWYSMVTMPSRLRHLVAGKYSSAMRK